MKKFFWLFLIKAICIQIVFAQTGGQPGELLRFGVGAQSFSMGRAYTAVSDGALSPFWNPANLSKVYWSGYNLDVMFMNLFGLARLNYFGFSFPLSKVTQTANNKSDSFWNPATFSSAIAFLNFKIGGIENRRDLTHSNGEFSDNQGVVYFSLSKNMKKYVNNLSLGINLKYYYRNFYNQKANALLLDFGAFYSPTFINYIKSGIIFRDINRGDIGFAGVLERVPLSSRMGFLFDGKNMISKYIKPLKMEFDYDIIAPGSAKKQFYFGAEYNLEKVSCSLPLTMQIGYNPQNRFSFGFSINFDHFYMPMQWQTQINWAMIGTQSNGLGNTNVLSFHTNGQVKGAWYYYQKGIKEYLQKISDWGEEYFLKALESPELHKKGGRAMACLRLGDIDILKRADAYAAVKYYQDALKKSDYCDKVNMNKLPPIDTELNRRSAYWYLQILAALGNKNFVEDILSKNEIWGINIPNDWRRQWISLIADYYSGNYPRITTSSDVRPGVVSSHEIHPEIAFIKAKTFFQNGKYDQAKELAKNIIRHNSKVDSYILPLFFPDTFIGDDAIKLLIEIARQQGNAFLVDAYSKFLFKNFPKSKKSVFPEQRNP